MSSAAAGKWWRLTTAGLVGIGLWVGASGTATGDRSVELKVSKVNGQVVGDVRIRVSVEPDALNRTLVVVAESDEFYRSSEFTLDGEDAARTHWIDWYRLPAGQYEVQAVVHGASGRRAVASQPLTILGFGSENPASAMASAAVP